MTGLARRHSCAASLDRSPAMREERSNLTMPRAALRQKRGGGRDRDRTVEQQPVAFLSDHLGLTLAWVSMEWFLLTRDLIRPSKPPSRISALKVSR